MQLCEAGGLLLTLNRNPQRSNVDLIPILPFRSFPCGLQKLLTFMACMGYIFVILKEVKIWRKFQQSELGSNQN